MDSSSRAGDCPTLSPRARPDVWFQAKGSGDEEDAWRSVAVVCGCAGCESAGGGGVPEQGEGQG